MEIPPITRKSSNGATFFDILNNDEILDEKTGGSYNEPHSASDTLKRIRSCRHRKIFFICLAWLIVIIALSSVLFHYSLQRDRNQIQNQFNMNCLQNTNLLKTALSQLIDELNNHVYFVSSIKQDMTFEMFSTFSKYATKDSLDYSLAWEPQVKQSERAAWEEINNLRISNHPSTTNNSDQSQLVYYPILYGIDYNDDYIGIDILRADQTGTVQKALGTLKTAVSPIRPFPITNVNGFSIYLPVLRDHNITDKGEYDIIKNNDTLLHENVLGLISISIRIDTVLKNTTRLFDGTIIRLVDNTDNGSVIYSEVEGNSVSKDISVSSQKVPFVKPKTFFSSRSFSAFSSPPLCYLS
ncbi:hypothetical protein K7432_016798 [Basidiobolus ranarum]|uniref:CHASE domain-containing protein n=1 Tax=Basidiobolus ranarum TaxID=34480 RepID=A0ABR2VL49_9FUNG